MATDSEIEDLAYDIVLDHLREGVEFIAVAEAVSDNIGDDEDQTITDKVYAEVQKAA